MNFNQLKIFLLLLLCAIILYNLCYIYKYCEGFNNNDLIDTDKLVEKIKNKIQKFDNVVKDLKDLETTLNN